jgi:hypothetical protein
MIQFVPKDSTFIPGPGRIFVFGSNTEGIHGAGAALTARKLYGAVCGRGEGLVGSSYALPTKDERLRTLSLEQVKWNVERFISLAWERRDLVFFVTRIGCGLAGFTDYDIAPLFKDAPPNCELPTGWENFEAMYGRTAP